jgi:PAS domain S-box-containing protein
MTEPLRLLTIDDEAPLRRAVRSTFEDSGFEVLEAESGRKGLAVFRERRPSVVLVDLRMPGMNGMEVIETLAREASDIPLVVLSGTGTIADAIEAIRRGAWDFVTKPIADIAQLEHVVRTVLERARLREESRRYQDHLQEEVAHRTRELVDLNSRLREVVGSVRRLAARTTLQDASERMLTELSTHTAAEGGCLYLIQNGTLALMHCLDPGHARETIPVPAPAGSILGRILTEMKPILIGDIASEMVATPSGWTGYLGGSLLAFPLLDNHGQLLGAVALHSKTATPFTPQERDVAEILVSHGAETIQTVLAYEELRQSEERFRTLFENFAAIPIQGYDADGTVHFWNRANEAVYGYTPDEALGRNLAELIIPPEMRPEVRGAIRHMAETGTPIPSAELSLMRKDGSRVSVFSSHAVVRLPGRPPELFCIDIDLTDRKRAEAEQGRLETQLRQAQKMETVGRLAGGIAHDLNNLLTPILGYAELAAMRLGPEKAKGLGVQEIQEAASRARDLTHQLLAFSRKQPMELKLLNLTELVTQFEKILRRTIREDIQLTSRLAPSLGAVRGDRAQLQQVLLNLAVNANDAMPSGGTLTITTDEVVCAAADMAGLVDVAPGPYVRLTVSDTGCGMDAEVEQHIFEPFYTTKPEGKGTGLGLATCYGIVTQHGGFFRVESALGQGTRFAVYLPWAGQETPAVAPTDPDRLTAGQETILFIDDARTVRMLLQNVLQSIGYAAIEAATPEAALRAAREHPGPIHLLITDVIMPGMNGRQLYEAIRNIRSDLKVLFLSGYTDDIIAPHGVLQPGIHFLAKPFTMAGLSEKIREALAAEA